MQLTSVQMESSSRPGVREAGLRVQLSCGPVARYQAGPTGPGCTAVNSQHTASRKCEVLRWQEIENKFFSGWN